MHELHVLTLVPLPTGQKHTVTANNGIHIEDLAPLMADINLADRFFRYHGSLTTPGCYESVTWFVKNNHPQITEAEVGALSVSSSPACLSVAV